MIVKRACIHLFIYAFLILSPYASTGIGDSSVGYNYHVNYPVIGYGDFSAHVPMLDHTAGFDYFNTAQHEGYIFNDVYYQYLGLVGKEVSEIYRQLIGDDYNGSNAARKEQYVKTPQAAVQLVALALGVYSNETKPGYAPFTPRYTVLLDEPNNCWQVGLSLDYGGEYPQYPNEGKSYYLVNRNDAKIIVIEYMGEYFRADKPDQNTAIGDSSTFLTGLSSWAADEVNSLNARGIIPNQLTSNFQHPIRRDEFTALIVNVYESAQGPVTSYSSPFSGIADNTHKTAIEKAKAIGLIDGTSANSFTPNDLLTREQAAKILCNAVAKIAEIPTKPKGQPYYVDSAAISEWALNYVAYAQENKIMMGSSTGRFNPHNNLTREEAMLAVERLIVQYGW